MVKNYHEKKRKKQKRGEKEEKENQENDTVLSYVFHKNILETGMESLSHHLEFFVTEILI